MGEVEWGYCGVDQEGCSYRMRQNQQLKSFKMEGRLPTLPVVRDCYCCCPCAAPSGRAVATIVLTQLRLTQLKLLPELPCRLAAAA